MQTTIVSDSIQQTICQAQKHVVDIQNWKKFKISDLFLVNPVKKLTVPGNTYLMDTYVVSEDGEYPYVAAVSRDNGVTGYTHFEPTNKGDCITMSTTADSSATVFYQPVDFVGRQQMAEIRRKDNLPLGLYCGLFLVPIFRRATCQFDFGNKLTMDFLKSCSIFLPSTPSGAPDWAYMETYMRKMLDNAGESLRILRQPVRRRTMIDMCEWKSFRMADFFEISHGTRLTKEWRIPGNIPLVTAGEQNHGVAEYIGNSEMKVYSNAITIDMFGNCFFHSGDCVGDDNIYFFINNDISDLAKIFISVVINRNHLNKFSFHRQFRMPDAVSSPVLLPSTSSGTPDWGYMESYMRKILQSAQNELSALKECVA